MAFTYARIEADGIAFQLTRAENGDVAIVTDGLEGLEGTTASEGHMSAGFAGVLGSILVEMAKEDRDE